VLERVGRDRSAPDPGGRFPSAATHGRISNMTRVNDKFDAAALDVALAANRIIELEGRVADLEHECAVLQSLATLLEEQLDMVRLAVRPLQ
jgi:hypothetical protein